VSHPPDAGPAIGRADGSRPAETFDARRPAHPIPRSKRALDLALAIPGLIVVPPVAVVTAVMMRLTRDRGPLLYRSQRIGEGGRPFRLFKFRSMRAEGGGRALTTSEDPRVTRVGRWLRRTKMDELPQLWNVVRGEMSLVGPRPEDPRYVDWEDPLHAEVFSCRPGITGPAQIRFRHEERWLGGTDIERRYVERLLPLKLALDAEYLRRQSVAADLRLLLATVGALFAKGDPE
jgi:lipopolysaccharide/colanic/teichoic acid biosynthesis glycosyltransferase